jgi:hypothetical protein
MDTQQALTLLGITSNSNPTLKDVTEAYARSLKELHEAFSIVVKNLEDLPVGIDTDQTMVPVPAPAPKYPPFDLQKFIEYDGFFVRFLGDTQAHDKETLGLSLMTYINQYPNNEKKKLQNYKILAEKIWHIVIQDPKAGFDNKDSGIGMVLKL